VGSGRVTLVLVAALAFAACSGGHHTSAPTSTVAPGPDPQSAAVTMTAGLLHRVVLPPGATPFAGTLPELLRAPFESEGTPDLVDGHRVWIVSEPTARVLGFERAHAPRGLVAAGCCGSETTATQRVDEVTFDATSELASTGPIASAHVLLEVSARTSTTTWMRAYAQAVWRPRRDPSTIVPATDRVITVTRGGRTAIVDRAKTVARIEAEFNRLPASVPVAGNGPCNQVGLTMQFRARRGDAADVSVAGICEAIEVTAHGHRQVLDVGTLVDDVLKATTG
jgi:hypothetical protein